MVRPDKQLARIVEKPSSVEEEEFGLLLSNRRGSRPPKGSSAKSRFIFHGSLFTFGLVASIGCLWAMLYTSRSEEVAENLGLHRVANSLENILSLLAYPVLMFSVILTAYAAQQLHRLHKEVTKLTSTRRRRLE